MPNADLQSLANRLVTEIAAAVRADVLGEVLSIVGGAGARGAPAKRRGRPPGTSSTTKAAKPAKRRKGRGRGVRSFTDADLARVIEAVKANPGKQPSQVQAASGVRENAFAAAVKKLKAEGKLKVVGKARGTSYAVA